ncbi:threonine-phosphate decarboxylase [Flavimaricola marinus]|uniref:Aminotransferase n=1 Tax=Flavimaricola marinus TaxID=1819565 RepID=A0A238LC33_9RHOB|nr:threonine-phosphate decarboxylase [Flavimaricola marinus]SMY06506.1 Threonine-phosphate decarboxylase [Flavimaricola marinus]
MTSGRDHGGGTDAAIARFGGARSGWLDLSTGINPVPYPTGQISANAWNALPDSGAFSALETAARAFWNVPAEAAVLAAPGASALIARIPSLMALTGVHIAQPTYNEHAAAFAAHGVALAEDGDAQVVVHPNNPTGRIWQANELRPARLTVIDESFCDVTPDASLIHLATRPGTIVLKSFGKFWGLAGLRLGFAIGDPALIGQLGEALGPWQISGPALEIGAKALTDTAWASETRKRTAQDAERLDSLISQHGGTALGGTSLFRLYEVDSATRWQDHLAQSHVWSRIFPYSDTWLRLGLPGPDGWTHLETALGGMAGGATAQPSVPDSPPAK